MSSIILTAAKYAVVAHQGQKRKYTGEPYVMHPARVAARMSMHDLATDDLVAIAWLHDTIEDTDITHEFLKNRFGDAIAGGVLALTNPSRGSRLPRAERKAIDRAHLSKAGKQLKVIKLLDRIDNIRDMAGAESSFVELYSRESLELLGAIGNADRSLSAELRALCDANIKKGAGST